jgi:DNA-binding transcriptional regulator YiaG
VITKSVTFEKKPVDPKAYKALDRIVAATEAMRAAEAERSKQARLRATSIKSARAWGMSYDTIAERLGVSRERVRQMVARDEKA